MKNRRNRRWLVGAGLLIGLAGLALVFQYQRAARMAREPVVNRTVVPPTATLAPTAALADPSASPAPTRVVVIPAFPGAEGFGSTTPGGRGGQVIAVTSLADSGPGTLRACAESSGPRVCVFRVTGTIEVQARIDLWNPFITIAGQSAPGGGNTLKNAPSNLQAPMAVLTHDVVIRHLRFRPGPSGEPSGTVDGLTIVHELDSEHVNEGVYNVVVDHVSLSWSTDEVLQTGRDVHDITVQWSIVAEGLNCSTHTDGCNSKGMLIGAEGARDISVHHNLFAHNVGRNPMLQTSGTVDVVNNVMHVPAQIAAVIDGKFSNMDGEGMMVANLVGNIVSAPFGDGLVYGARALSDNVLLYVRDNFGPYRTKPGQADTLFVRARSGGDEQFAPQRAPAPAVTTSAAQAVFGQVLDQAGATQGLDDNGEYFWRRDSVDERIVTDVRTLHTRIVDDPAEVGGWPVLAEGEPYTDADADGMADAWETRYFDSLSRGASASSADDFDLDGYTDLEEFLNATDPTDAAD